SRTLSQICVAIVACLAVSSFAFGADLEKGQFEANGLVGIVTGIGTHTVVGFGGGKAIMNNVSLNGDFSYIPLGSINTDVLGVQTKSSAKGGGLRSTRRYSRPSAVRVTIFRSLSSRRSSAGSSK